METGDTPEEQSPRPVNFNPLVSNFFETTGSRSASPSS